MHTYDNMPIDRDRLIRAMQDATGEDDVADLLYENYSGRGMFGRSCFGFKCDNPALAAMILLRLFAEEIADGDYEGIDDMLIDQRQDNLGFDYIVYFPAYTVDAQGDPCDEDCDCPRCTEGDDD